MVVAAPTGGIEAQASALSSDYDRFIAERAETKRKAFATVVRVGLMMMGCGILILMFAGFSGMSVTAAIAPAGTFLVVSGLCVLSTLPVEGSEVRGLDEE
jgi:cytochrome c biogenesis protein CcdA